MVIILGPFPLFGKRIERELNQRSFHAKYVSYSDSKKKEIKKIIQRDKIIHFIGSPSTSLIQIKNLIYFKIFGKRIVVNWIGYDVRKTKGNFYYRFLAKICEPLVDINIATSPNLVQDLKSVGINCKFQPIPVYSIYKIRDFPSKNKVAVYLPDWSNDEWEFYQGDIIKKLVKEFPDVEFIIVRNSGHRFSEKNVKCIPWVEDMEDIYSNVKGVIRLPKNDGTSGTIIEALSMGREMIASNTWLPSCKMVNNFENAKKHLKSIIMKTSLNREGSEYVHKNFNMEKLSDELISIYHDLE